VLGEPGIGKSRLVQEFISTIGDQARVLRGRCLPYGEGITYWPVAEVVKEAARVTDAESAEHAVAMIASLLDETDDPVIAERVASVIGIAEGQVPQVDGFWAVRRFLETLGRRLPL